MAILVGSVEVDVVPNAQRFIPNLRRELVPGAREIGNEIGDTIGDAIAKRIREKIGDPFRGLPSAPAREHGRKTGDDFGGAFNETVQTKIRAALRNLPTPQIGVATSEAEQKLRDLRNDLATLTDKTVGVDVNAADATAEVARIREELARLGAESVDVQVRTDTAAAVAKLAELEAELARLDGRDVDVDVNARVRDDDLNTFVGRLQAIALAGAALGPAIVPAAAAATAALGAIGPAAVAAGTGVGVLALAFAGIGGAVTATQAAASSASQDAATSAAAIAAATSTLAGAQAAAEAATASLANAVASADSAAVRSAQAVADARLGVTQATERAAAANTAAASAYAAAERQVQAAVVTSANAQRDLTQAREDARRQLEDLASQAANGALDERAGVLAVTEAQQALNKAKLDPKANATSIAEAQLAYDRSVQQLEDTRARNKRVAEDKAKADKKGVEGSDLVRDAQQRVTDAVTAEKVARAAAATAAAKITQTKVDGARSVAKAEESVTAALAAQVDQARQSAAAIASAQDSVASSQRSLAQAEAGLLKAQTTTSSAAQKAAASLAGLSPAGAEFVGFVNDRLRPALTDLRAAAQEGILPGVQDALTGLLPFLPGLTAFVSRLASAMGDLFRKAGQALQAPFWRTFASDISKAAGPALDTFAGVIGNLAEGFGGLLDAFIPFSAIFGQGLLDLTGRFADWSKGLSTNTGFQKFIDYATENGPLVVDALGQIVGALLAIIKAAAPIGVVVVAVLDTLARIIEAIPTPILTTVIALFGAYAIQLGYVWARTKLVAFWTATAEARTIAWTAAQWLLNVALDANPIGLIILGVAALVVAIVLVVKHFGFFRHAAVAVFDFFKNNWPLILTLITGPVGAAVALVLKHWGAIRRGASAVVAFVKTHWPELLAIITGPIGAAALAVAKNWGAIKRGAGAAKDYVVEKFDALVGYFAGLPAKIGAAVSGLWDGLTGSFKTAINTMIGWWNNLQFHIGGQNFLGVSIPDLTLDTPDIPMLAAGGVVTGPTVAMIGERGPEAVVPLTDSALLASLLGKASAAAGGPPAAAGSRTVNVTQTIVNPVPERASVSGPAALRRAALALGG